MTPTVLYELAEAEHLIRAVAARLPFTQGAADFHALLNAAARLSAAREALHEIARAPIPDTLREPGRLRVIQGGRSA